MGNENGHRMSPAQVSQIGRHYDLDCDGVIQFDEFLQMMVELEADSKFKWSIWFISFIVMLAALALALQYVMTAVGIVVVGLALYFRGSSSHWGEFEQVMPAWMQQLNYRCRWILILI